MAKSSTSFKKGTSGNPGQYRKNSIREQLRFVSGLTDEERKRLKCSPFSQAQRLAIRRFELSDDDWRAIDSLSDQIEGKPKETVEQTVTIEIIDKTEKPSEDG